MGKGTKKLKGTVSEFKKFISRGNVIDLAVGVIIGSAFTAIVNSLVNDIIMPIISFIIGSLKFDDLKFVIREADVAADTAEVAILYGSFIQRTIDFLIIALVVFLMVKWINAMRDKMEKLTKKEEAEAKAAEAPAITETDLLIEIRDILKKK